MKRKMTRHHIRNKCKGGNSRPQNIIRLWNDKHQAWHKIFGNHSFLEAANLLVKAHNLKNRTTFYIERG